MMVVGASREGDESSCVLKKMVVIVFRSCLQRPKDMIFEGFVREFGYGVGGRRKMMMKKKRRRRSREKSEILED